VRSGCSVRRQNNSDKKDGHVSLIHSFESSMMRRCALDSLIQARLTISFSIHPPPFSKKGYRQMG